MRKILKIAVPSPLRKTLDYFAPDDLQTILPGVRVKVPLRNREIYGLLVDTSGTTDINLKKLKKALAVIDTEPLLPDSILHLVTWASQYYHYPIGEAIAAALPVLLRQGYPAEPIKEYYWRLTNVGKTVDPATLKRAPKQTALLTLLQTLPEGLNSAGLREAGYTPAQLNPLITKGWVEITEYDDETNDIPLCKPTHLSLNNEQHQAVQAITDKLGQFQTFLLQGITGSGKTEVYLQVIEQVLRQGKQALVLVPEINLTPQTIARFQQRFTVPVAVLHSQLNDRQRLNNWLKARLGQARVIIGTRSAIFTPFADLGIIIVDEEHDASFKQHEGFRYSARDLAVLRGQFESIPVILGSATPSLESLLNVYQYRYIPLKLPQRAGNALEPQFKIIDLRGQLMDEGLSESLLASIKKHLDNDQQVLVFLNRRGFAPMLLCHRCGWIASCKHCDAPMTLHLPSYRLQCHHCGASRISEKQCPDCQNPQLMPMGLGTQRIELALKRHFPDAGIARIDRDSTRRKNAMENLLEDIHSHKKQLLIGTQMLAKGHHFPKVTLVAVLNADHGLFSADFRASEHLAQLLLQVAGRAGREDKPGEVLIQTFHPHHPLLQVLIEQGYEPFAQTVLAERHHANLPPYSYLALIRAEALHKDTVFNFLEQIREIALQLKQPNVTFFGPIPAPLQRKAAHYRMQLFIQSPQRSILQNLLTLLVDEIENLKAAKQVRWVVDVDPVDLL